MIKLVNWLIMEEEETLGFINLNGDNKSFKNQIFVVEKAQRFDAPDLYISDSLKDTVLRFCSLDEEDLEDPEEKEYFDRIYEQAEEEIKKAESKSNKGVNHD